MKRKHSRAVEDCRLNLEVAELPAEFIQAVQDYAQCSSSRRVDKRIAYNWLEKLAIEIVRQQVGQGTPLVEQIRASLLIEDTLDALA